jgi:hypothetical protein
LDYHVASNGFFSIREPYLPVSNPDQFQSIDQVSKILAEIHSPAFWSSSRVMAAQDSPLAGSLSV